MTQTTALDRVKVTKESLEAVLRALVRPSRAPATTPKVAPPAILTKEQSEAIADLHLVYGSVQPETSREITPAEASDLVSERRTLDRVIKACEDRKAAIRTIIYHHFDREADRVGVDGEAVDDDTPRDKDGHYATKGEIGANGKRLTREVSHPAPTVSPEALYALAQDPDYPAFTHADYLAWTTQTRVVDEHKVMAELRLRPDLIEALAKASTAPPPKSSHYLR